MLNKLYAVVTAVMLATSSGMLSIVAASDTETSDRTTSFEQAIPGRFDRVDTELGTWIASGGPVVIDDKHAKTGKQCLWLAGPKAVVELDIADKTSSGDQLTFFAERWTARGPFSFRIERLDGSVWSEIYTGDDQIRVGRSFLSSVTVSLGECVSGRLRFTVTSPPETGILIDDVRIAKPQPQTLVSASVVPTTLPVLVGNDACPLMKLRIETSGSLNPIRLESLAISLSGTSDIADIESAQVICTGSRDRFDWQGTAVATDAINVTSETLAFTFPPSFEAFDEGVNYLWIACKLKPSANIDHRVGVSCDRIAFSNGQTIDFDDVPNINRMGIAVRKGGDDGVHTYRIPGLITTQRGTLIAVYDVRYRNGGDLPGDIDVGMSRSVDGGRSWEPMKIIMDMGNDPKYRYDGIGDPAILVDRLTGTLWVASLWSHGDRAWNGSGPGIKAEETGQLMLARSDDDGVTWSKPINITSQVKQSPWCLILQGPGKGITMRDGTLVFAAQYQDSPAGNRLPHSTIIYSHDRGETWQVGSGAFDDTTEAQVVESRPGELMLNCRYNRAPFRVVMTSTNFGKTWQKHTTSEHALIEPHACMASLIDVGSETTRDSKWLLFSNPNSATQRHRLTIKGSPDRGLTWPPQHQLLIDEGLSAGYSCMTMIDDETIGIIYEGSQSDMTFQRIALDSISQ